MTKPTRQPAATLETLQLEVEIKRRLQDSKPHGMTLYGWARRVITAGLAAMPREEKQ